MPALRRSNLLRRSAAAPLSPGRGSTGCVVRSGAPDPASAWGAVAPGAAA
jgi:hypothetical protein